MSEGIRIRFERLYRSVHGDKHDMRRTYLGYRNETVVEASLAKDTLPRFNDDPFEIEDWAENNINWSEVVEHARLINEGETDYQEGWVNGDKELADL